MPPVKATKGTPLPRAKVRTQERDKKGRRSPTEGSFARRLLHVGVLAVLLTVVAAPTLLPKFSVVDNDIWLHLKVGDWILEHSAVPHTGILSRTVADRPWAAYSWVYEVLLSFFHSRFHLAGISVYGLLLTLAVAYSVFWMTHRLSGRFWTAALLATITCAAFLFRVFPRPVFFSMSLFTVTLTLLLEARRTGRPQLLYWLPPMFVLWANTHIQFIYGIFLVGVFVAVSVTQDLAARRGFAPDSLLPARLPSRTLVQILAACLLATCIGPYTYHLYPVIFSYAASMFPYLHVAEFQALSFRTYTDFVQLLLTGFAFFALGRRKQLDLYLFLLLVAGSVIGFRSQRDAWFACIPAAACLSQALHNEKPESRETVWEKAGIAAAVALLIFLYARAMDFTTPNLRLAINAIYPVQAINFLHSHPQPGPLYNNYSWGDFISWYLPEFPVAIDGRTDLYGDELDNRFFLTENGDPSWRDDPYLDEAKLVLLPREKPLAGLLRSDSRFSVIYEDSLSAVFVRR
ncbi:MAG TPA: hypothetical protein VGV15_08965 [Terriglobales bacterium]|nr:hypothetical protein [Terriglobales bacterium]